MSETMVDDALEPVRETVREMIRQKKDEIDAMGQLSVKLQTRLADLAVDAQAGLVELHQLELALKRLEGDGRGE